MQLCKRLPELVWHGQSDVSGVLEQTQAFITQVEADHCAAQCAAAAYDMHIDDVCHADQHQDQHLLADTLEANGAGQFSVGNRTHHAADVVQRHEHNQRDEHAVHTAYEVTKPSANGSDGDLDLCPDQVDTLEVSAHTPDGFSQGTVRTDSENCRTLHVDNFGFEN